MIFSHNDFLNGNILKNSEGILNLIDYEYGCYNLRAFDLANFITESLFDYSKKEYPTFEYHADRRDGEEAIKDMLKFYLLFSTSKSELCLEDAYELAHDEALAELMLLENFEGDMERLDSELDKLHEEYNICLLLSHWLWLVWGIVVSKNPDINFGYVEFSFERVKDYQNLKNKIYNN